MHSSQHPAAGMNTEATYIDAGWLKGGWSTAREAVLGCRCLRSRAEPETCTLTGSHFHSWENPSGSDRKASFWGTPTSCWPSSGGARSHWPGWETEWVGCNQRQSCGGEGTRSSSGQPGGDRGCGLVPDPGPSRTKSRLQGWCMLDGCCGLQDERWSLGCRHCWPFAPLCSWSHRALQAGCSDCPGTCSRTAQSKTWVKTTDTPQATLPSTMKVH